jgi:hypothetical protein
MEAHLLPRSLFVRFPIRGLRPLRRRCLLDPVHIWRLGIHSLTVYRVRFYGDVCATCAANRQAGADRAGRGPGPPSPLSAMLLSGKAEIVAQSNNKLANLVIADHANRRDFRAGVFAKLVRAYYRGACDGGASGDVQNFRKSLEGTDIPQRSGRVDKTADPIMKTKDSIKSKILPLHFTPMTRHLLFGKMCRSIWLVIQPFPSILCGKPLNLTR